jgi:hypothetical protein
VYEGDQGSSMFDKDDLTPVLPEESATVIPSLVGPWDNAALVSDLSDLAAQCLSGVVNKGTNYDNEFLRRSRASRWFGCKDTQQPSQIIWKRGVLFEIPKANSIPTTYMVCNVYQNYAAKWIYTLGIEMNSKKAYRVHAQEVDIRADAVEVSENGIVENFHSKDLVNIRIIGSLKSFS